MANIGTAYVKIAPQAPGIESKVESLLNQGGGGAEKAGLGLGKKLLGGIAALGIGAAIGKTIKDAFEAGGNLQQSFGGLDTLYGETSDLMKYFSSTAAKAGISMNTYAEQAVSFGASLKQAYGGDTLEAAKAANTAILDMADNAAKMGTPLESIQNAYQGFAKGNYTMLDNLKLGYGGTKEEMERLLADAQKLSGVEYDMSNLGDVYSAIHVVQEELGIAGVASEEAATTLTGSFGAMKASWENVLAALTTGENMDMAMQTLSQSVGNFANNILTMLQNLAPQLPGLILSLADVIIDHAPDFIASGIELIVKLAVGLVNGIPKLLAKVPEIFRKCKAAFAQVDWATLGKDLINGIIRGLTMIASSLWNKAKEIVKTALDRAKGVDWKQLGKDAVNGIISGLVSAATNLYRKVKDIIKKALKSGQNAAETGSPSRLFANELGRWIPAGVAMGIEDNMGPLDRAMQSMMSDSLGMAQVGYSPAAYAPAGTNGAINLYIDGIKYNTDDYVDSSITNFVEAIVRKGQMYGRA